MTPQLDTLIHLFEHTIEPIVLFGSEIWGTVNILSSKIKKADFFQWKYFEKQENSICLDPCILNMFSSFGPHLD